MSSVILTSYFTKKPHPNLPNDPNVVGRGDDGFVRNDDFSYIQEWYGSILKNNLNGYIFHDNLSDSFIDKYGNKNVTFLKVEDSPYSNNDYRFFCFRNFLKHKEFDYVFHTDVSDVVVVKDPESLIKNHNNFNFYACRDSIKISEFPYLYIHEKNNWVDKMKILLNSNRWDLINMGVVGGNHHDMLMFYDSFCRIRKEMQDESFNANMWICQYLLRLVFSDKKTMVGSPVCSDFKKYQKNRRDVYFIHK